MSGTDCSSIRGFLEPLLPKPFLEPHDSESLNCTTTSSKIRKVNRLENEMLAIAMPLKDRQSCGCSKYALGLNVLPRGKFLTATFLAVKCSFLQRHVTDREDFVFSFSCVTITLLASDWSLFDVTGTSCVVYSLGV